MLSNLNKRELVILIVAIIIIVFTLYYVYIYNPLVEEIDRLEAEIENKENEVRTAQNMVKRLPELRERYQILTEKTDYVNFFNIANDKLLVELKQIADDNNIVLRSFRPNASESKIDISMSIESSYFDLNRFLTELKRFEYWMDYKVITIRPTDQNLNVNLSLTFHRMGLIGGDNQ